MSALVDGSEASESAASPPFDAKRTRRFKRMFDKYCDPGGLIGEADLSKLFEDCGTAGPTSAAGLYDLLERFKSHDDGAREDAKEGVKVRAMLSWMGARHRTAPQRERPRDARLAGELRGIFGDGEIPRGEPE